MLSVERFLDLRAQPTLAGFSVHPDRGTALGCPGTEAAGIVAPDAIRSPEPALRPVRAFDPDYREQIRGWTGG